MLPDIPVYGSEAQTRSFAYALCSKVRFKNPFYCFFVHSYTCIRYFYFDEHARFYIVSTGGGKPYRLKIRSPSFIHMGAFDHMSRGYMIADAITLFGTYDIVMGECDR